MKKFEIGKEYFDRSACNHDCIFTIKIIKHTEKTVTFERNGKTRRAKLFFDERGEYIIPERYSMAPVFRAENEVQPEEEPSVEEAAAETSCGVEIVQPADVNTVVVMVGQRVERVCGACYPPQGGTVIGFVSLPDTRFFHGGVFAMVLYDGAKSSRTCPPVRHSPPRVALSRRFSVACLSPDALPGRRFPPPLSRRCIYRNGAKFFCFFAFSLLTLY